MAVNVGVAVDVGVSVELGVNVTISDQIGLEAGHLTGSFLTNSRPGTGGGIVVITEGANGPTSDLLTIQWTVEANPNGGFNIATINLDFVSDGEKSLPPTETTLPVLATIVESGDFQELSGVPKLVPENITIQFRSDVEAVPAPSALALMLAGLLPLGWSYARRRS